MAYGGQISNWYYSLNEAASDKPYVEILDPKQVLSAGAVLPASDAPDWCHPTPVLPLSAAGTRAGMWRYGMRPFGTVQSQLATTSGQQCTAGAGSMLRHA